LAIGLCAGAVLAAIVTSRIHKSVEKTREYKYTRKMVLYIIMGITVTAIIGGYFSITSPENGYLVLNSFFILTIVTYAAEFVLHLYWEMKNHLILMSDDKPSRVYAVQK
jgi:hypothetical protein